MKAKLFTKTIAMVLSVIMVISLLPLSVFAYESNSNMEYVDGGSAEAALYEQLGYGFNALSDTAIKDTTLKSSAGVVIDYDAVKASLLSTSYSEADVKYAKTAQDLMLSFGIDYTNQSSVGLPIENAKFGFASKFGFSADIKYKTITESLYYYYREEILTGKYSLVIPAQMLDDPEQIISEDFVYALEKLNTNYSDEKCADFFNKWGTHILISYNKGAALEYVAVGHSTGKEFSANAEITNEMSASAGIGDLKAESTQALAVKLGVAYNGSEYNLSHKWFGMGGDSNLIGANGADASTISATSIENWKATVSQDKSVLIPQSTEWISIWELIPDAYAGAKTALQAYYKAQANGVNAAFFSQFTTYSEVSGATDIYYTSPTGHISKIAYYADGSTKVAPNSKFNVVNLDADLSKIVFPASNQYTVDKYGMVTMKATSGKVKVLITDLEGNEITGATKTFTVEKEGAGLFAGGYGTKERPYLISNATQFSNIRNYPSAVFSLTNNISLGTMSPIDEFKGTLDGNGYTLSGWNYSPTTSGNAGLFRSISSGATVNNFTLSGGNISSTDGAYGTLNIGLVCGTNNGTIRNVVVNGKSNIYGDMGYIDQEDDSHTYVGGICGTNCGTIERCGVINSTISGYSGSGRDGGTANTWVGGITGRTLSNSKIFDCYSYGNTITATAKGKVHKVWFSWVEACGWANIGGLVGRTDGSGIAIKRALSYSNTISGTVEGADSDKNQGSLIGYVYSTPTMENCYSESSDTLFGQGSASGAYKVSSATAVGTISSLTGFAANGWIQSSSGGHLSIAQNTKLTISGGDRNYFIGEPLNLKGLAIQAVKNDATGTRTDITGGFTASGYDPNKVGTQTVTITYGNIKGTYNVTVSSPELSGIVISSTPYKTTYFKPFAKTNFKGEKLDFTGLSVIAQYTDGTTAEIPLEVLILPNATIVTESKNIVVTYNGFTANYKIEAFDVLPSKIEVIENSYKKNYALGDTFDSAGLSVKLTYNNGDTETLGVDLLTVDSTMFDKDLANTYSITVKYEGLETTFDVIVGSVKSISIATLPDKLSYYSSEKKLVTDGLSLNVTYDNGATKSVSAGFSVDGYDNTDIGKQDITITYGGATTSFQITVIAVEMTSVEISEYPKTTYYVGNAFTSGGLTLKVNYNDGSSKEIPSGFTVKLDGYDVDVYPTLITLGSKNVLVAYTENGIRKTVEYEIEIVKDTITELQVVQDPNKTTYNLWDDSVVPE
ncbi:MAG: bacterial Ig-like domain-containing protein [Clostridia bacterium]|nr:bacterial Ig-like domain-containing protein [Clostridia bacterium]